MTNRHLCQDNYLDVIAAAIDGGIEAIILREKDLVPKELHILAKRVKDLTASAGIPLIINGNIEVAQAIEADGVHLGEGSLPPSVARKILRPGMWLGQSIHSLQASERLIENRETRHLDYFLFGNVYSTSCKPGKPAQGLGLLTEVVRCSPIPVVAIGGIDKTKVEAVKACGAAGVAVMSTVMTSPDPKSTVRELADATGKGILDKIKRSLWSKASFPVLYGIIGQEQADDNSLQEKVQLALEGGCDVIQLREKDLSTAQYLKRARMLRELTRKYEKMLIINDRIDIAMATEADGVHIGQEDMPLGAARRLWPNGIIGVTVRNIEQARMAASEGADYVGAGPVFRTYSKMLDAQPLQFDGLKQICSLVPVPVIAIGGIQETNIQGIRETGCQGVAVISALFGNGDAAKAARDLKVLLQS